MILRLGFIGTGGIARLHGRQLADLSDEVQITALADPSEEGRTSFKEQFGLTDVQEFADYKNLLQEDIDGVVICSPHTLHYEQATNALKSGLHVLMEKPMVCSSKEAEDLMVTAEQSGKILQVSYQRHFDPQFLYIKQAIDDGVLGELTSITASIYQGWRDGTKNKWRQVPELSGGGFLMDTGSHIIDVVLWTTSLTPVQVKTQLDKRDTAVEIDSYTSIRFDNGALGGLNMIGQAPPCFHETYVFSGENGALFYDNGKITLRLKGEKEPITPELPAQTTNQDKSFIDAINGKHDVLVPADFAIKVVKLTEAIYESANYKPF